MKHSLYFFLIIVSIIISREVVAQDSFQGRIVTKENNAIPYANVILLSKGNNQFITGTVSQENGNFSIPTKEHCVCYLKVSYIGYQDLIIDLSGKANRQLGDLIISSSDTELGEVTVSEEANFITKTDDKYLINIQSSPLKSGYNGVEVLQRSPFVQVDSRNNILIRNETATILINGKATLMKGGDLSSYLMNIDSENIVRIEIQTNKDASTDAESSGGIINIVLKRKSVGFNALMKSYYTYKRDDNYTGFSSVSLNYGSDKFNVYAKYEHLNSQTESISNTDIQYLLSKKYIKTNRVSLKETNRNNYQFGFVSNIHPNHEIGLEIFGSESLSNHKGEGDISIKNNNIEMDNAVINNLSFSNKNLINGMLNYSWTIDTANSKLRFYIDYSKQSLFGNTENISIYEVEYFGNNKERTNTSAETEVYALQLDYNKDFKKGYKLKTGIKYIQVDRANNLTSKFLMNDYFVEDTNRTSRYNYNESINSGYVSVNKTFKKKNYIKLGVRVENTDLERVNDISNNHVLQNYTQLFPSLYYSRTIKKRNSISTSFSRSIRRPSFALLNNNITKINDFRFVLGNPDLEPEYVSKIDVSYLLKRQTFSIYYNHVGNAINGIYFTEGDIAYYKKFNSGSQIQQGFEYNISKKIKPWWYTKFSANIFNRKFKNEQNIEQFKQTTFYVNSYSNFKINKTTSIDISAYYLSPKSDAFYEASERYKVDLVLKKSFFDKKLNVRLYFDDIFNTLQYQNIRAFDDYTTTAIEKPITRSVTLWLTYNFATKQKLNKRKNVSKNNNKNRL